MDQENTEMYDTHIKSLYSWFEKATKSDESGNCKHIPDIKLLNITSTNDMSATWKMLGKGGTAKVKAFFVIPVTVHLLQLHTTIKQCVSFVPTPLKTDRSGTIIGNVIIAK